MRETLKYFSFLYIWFVTNECIIYIGRFDMSVQSSKGSVVHPVDECSLTYTIHPEVGVDSHYCVYSL